MTVGVFIEIRSNCLTQSVGVASGLSVGSKIVVVSGLYELPFERPRTFAAKYRALCATELPLASLRANVP